MNCQRTPWRRHRRPGRAVAWTVLVLGFGTVASAGTWLIRSIRSEDPGQAPLMARVTRGPFDHIVLEHGDVESSSNVEIQCEVKSKNTSGTAIIDVVAEGTYVQKGDWLVTLDSSALQEEYKKQKVAVNAASAAMVAAKSALEQARIAKTEYLEGTFKSEEQLIASEILVAEENLSRARETAKFSQRLAAMGFQTALQLKADLFAVEQAQVELDLAKGRLQTLRDITQQKMLIGFNSDIESAQAKYEAETDSYAQESDKLKEIEDQIAKCDIHAPAAGQVVYANIYSRRGGSAEFVVEPGAMVRERQPVIYLPDPTRMQVKALINESNITLVKENMPVDIRIGAYDDQKNLVGRVRKVNKYAEAGSWFSSQVKEYAAFVQILEPPPEIRTGMTAEVRIFVEQFPDALQVPVQALYEHKGKMFCLVKSDQDDWETREVQMGATNDKMVTIVTGLAENEEVVLNPRGHLEKLQLPTVAEPKKLIAEKPSHPTNVDEVAARQQRTAADSPSAKPNAPKRAGDGA